MDNTEDALGHLSIGREILEELKERPRSIVGIRGPPGSGKSWLARAVGGAWASADGSAVVALGDEGRRSEDFGVFGDSLRPLDERWGLWSSAAQAIVRAFEPRVGLPGALDVLLSQSRDMKMRAARDEAPGRLTEQEFEAIHSLEKVAQGDPLLLIADGLHKWDERSLDLLHRIYDTDLAEAFPFLKDLRVLGVWTTSGGRPPDAPDPFHSLARNRMQSIHELEYCSRAEFPDTLRRLGLRRSLRTEVLDRLYAACSGHLVLMKEIVEVLNQFEEEVPVEGYDASWADDLFSLRIRKIGKEIPELRSALRCAAIIGGTTSRKELQCLTDLRKTRLDALVERATDLRILEEWDGHLAFTHDWFRDALAADDPAERRRLHREFAECLRIVRPGDYATRSFHFRAADEDDAADRFLVMALLAKARNESPMTAFLEQGKEELLDRNPRLGEFLTAMLNAYEAYAEADFDKATSITAELRKPPDRLLHAELDYLYSLARGYQKDLRGRELALENLESWEDLADTELEIGTRISMLAIYLLMHLGELTEAKAREEQIYNRLASRMRWDREARHQLHVLDRRSNSLYQPEIAMGRLQDAVSYFGPEEGNDVPRSHLEYFRSVNNLSATLISLDRSDEAYEELQKLAPIAESIGVEVFQRPEYALNNMVLSGFRADEITLERGIEILTEISTRERTASDNFLMRNNLGVLAALSEDLERAHDIFEETLEEILDLPQPEPYFQYVLGTNMAGVKHVLGRADAKDVWDTHADAAEDIGDPSGMWHTERVRVLEGAFDEVEPGDPQAFHRYPLREEPGNMGKPWRHYGRGFQATGIHIWAEA